MVVGNGLISNKKITEQNISVLLMMLGQIFQLKFLPFLQGNKIIITRLQDPTYVGHSDFFFESVSVDIYRKIFIINEDILL